jgi:hypothetical protein
MLWVCFVSGGATCARRDATLALPPPPPILSGTPDLEEVAAAVNRTSTIRELSSNSVAVDVVSMPALPELSATLALRKEKDFRLRARLPIVMASGLDMGSNQELFWFEVPDQNGIQKTLFYARHEQYQQQLSRAVLPVDPTWLIDALGLVQIDPGQVVAGPVMRPDGKLEIRSNVPTPAGTYQRVCYVDPTAGHVTDQLLYAPASPNVPIARAAATNHRFYAEQNCSLPHTVQLTLSPAVGEPVVMKLDVGSYAVNQILSGDPNLFNLPQTNGKVVDLMAIPPGAMAGMVAPASYQRDELGPMPYRGLVKPK